jgi:hypothetical protein
VFFDEDVFPCLSDSEDYGSEFKVEDYFVEEVTTSTALATPDVKFPLATAPVLPVPVHSPQPSSQPPSIAAQPACSSLISSDISQAHILPYRRRAPQAYVSTEVGIIPAHYNQALSSPDSSSWIEAIGVELAAMDCLGVWTVVD